MNKNPYAAPEAKKENSLEKTRFIANQIESDPLPPTFSTL